MRVLHIVFIFPIHIFGVHLFPWLMVHIISELHFPLQIFCVCYRVASGSGY